MLESLTELVKNTGSQNSFFGLQSSGCGERPGWALCGARHSSSLHLWVFAFDTTHGTPTRPLRPSSKIASSSLKPGCTAPCGAADSLLRGPRARRGTFSSTQLFFLLCAIANCFEARLLCIPRGASTQWVLFGCLLTGLGSGVAPYLEDEIAKAQIVNNSQKVAQPSGAVPILALS